MNAVPKSAPMPDPDSDAAILAALSAHPGLLEVARGECDAAVNRCYALNQAPRGWILWKIEQVRDRIRKRAGDAGGDKIAVDVASFREYRAAVRVFDALAERWERAPHLEASRAISAELEREIADDERRRRIANQPQPVPPPPFNARNFVDGLAARGVVLVVDAKGGLSAMPSSKLTEQDRVTIHTHRSAVASAAASLVERF